MEQLQRYELESVGGQSFEPSDRVMVARPKGDYVLHADHAKREAELLALLRKWRTSFGCDCDVCARLGKRTDAALGVK